MAELDFALGIVVEDEGVFIVGDLWVVRGIRGL
jgi:hypothetical protein